jgi:signal transduction histidine kinase
MFLAAVRFEMVATRFNWSKIHLIYFALAAFDLMAVLLGLWLSNSTRADYQESARDSLIADILYDDARRLRDAAIAINAPGNQLFQGIDLAKARADVKQAKAEFELALTTDAIDPSNSVLMRGMISEGQSANSSLDRLHGGLKVFYPEKFSELDAVKSRLGVLLTAMNSETSTAINSLHMGDDRSAATHLAKSVDAFEKMLKALDDWDEIGSSLSHAARLKAENSMSFAQNMQYVIGMLILAMVAAVSFYGHAVGKLLKKKFEDLEGSHAEIATFNVQLQTVNDDVTLLNKSLADNMEQLKLAQAEIIRKGKMAQLGQLTATVAHEIRNPLGAARTSIYLLDRKIKGKALGVEPQVERINSAITRCDNIITQLLDFSRARTAQCQDVVLDDWLVKLIAEEADKLPANLAVTLELNSGDQKVRFDPDRMQRVLVNLVHNASEAMISKGKDGKSADTVDPHITVRSQVVNGRVEISVKDNGPGIPADLLQKVFDPLFTTKSFGTGLGLPAVENIMHQHGGTLVVQSTFGEGAMFTASWPSGGPAEQIAA